MGSRDIIASTVNNVGRDQTNNYIVYSSCSHTPITLSKLNNDRVQLNTNHRASRKRTTRSSAAYTSELVGISTDLIAKIVCLLRGGSSLQYQHLEIELNLLVQSLFLTRDAVLGYKSTPLGSSLAKTVNPAVERCQVVLQEMFNGVEPIWQALEPTSIGSLWARVFWSGDYELGIKLSACRKSTDVFLMALNSVGWVELGNELHTSHVPLSRFYTSLKKYLPSLHHIQVDKVLVVDHLGQNISVPTLFCSTWKGFDHIIKGYCKNLNLPGKRFIEHGDYQVIRAADSQSVSPYEFTSIVDVGMVFEMSIVLRQEAAFQENKEKCLRCGHINRNVTTKDGWIECSNCLGLFEVEKGSHGCGDCNGSGEGKKANRSEEYGPECSDVEDEETGGSSDEETVSLDSPTRGSNTGQRADSHYPWDDDEAQYFRRIHVIYLDNTPLSAPFAALASDILSHLTTTYNVPAAVDKDAVESATQLHALAKSQRGGEKRLTQGRSYLVITQEYLNVYGDLLPTNEKQRIMDQLLRLEKIQSRLKERMGKRPFFFKFFRVREMLRFSHEAALLLTKTKKLSDHSVSQHCTGPMTETASVMELPSPGMTIISIPSDQIAIEVSMGEIDDNTAIAYESVWGDAPRPAFIMPMAILAEELEKTGHAVWRDT